MTYRGYRNKNARKKYLREYRKKYYQFQKKRNQKALEALKRGDAKKALRILEKKPNIHIRKRRKKRRKR